MENTITLRSPRELEAMRAAGRIVNEVLDTLEANLRPGITTKELDEIAAEVMKRHGAVSGSLHYGADPSRGYKGYPGWICISVNDEIVHGIPGPRRLREGDIVSLDVALSYNGYFADSTRTVPVGEVSDLARKLLEVTRTALFKGIEQARAGNRLGDVSHAIQRHVEENGFHIVKEFVGHGVGRSMHEPPQVPHFGEPNRGILLRPGMVMAIEPQVTVGPAVVRMLPDGWTAVTEDGSLAAHFEHTVAVTQNGPLILTLPERPTRPSE